MATSDFEKASDIFDGTFQHLATTKPALANFANKNYQLFNKFVQSALKIQGGDELEGHITLNSESNAGHVGIWDQDDLAKKNINQKYTIPWRHAKGGMLWNLLETAVNSSSEKIFSVLDQQYDSCVKDIIEAVYLALCTGPTSASDVNSPYSIFSWLSLGTQASTGGWTGYSGRYNDSSTPGTAFNKGGVSCSSSNNAGWATYYADHQGNKDDSCLTLLDRAVRKLNFQAPVVPKTIGSENGLLNFSMYTSDAMLSALNAFYAKSDDNMGYHPDSHWGTPTFRSIPFAYVDIFDTTRDAIYGDDPIVGINHSNLYPVIHTDWNFKEVDGKDPNRAVVLKKMIYVMYNVFCKNPAYAGFLISNHPSN